MQDDSEARRRVRKPDSLRFRLWLGLACALGVAAWIVLELLRP